jgi:hypothetical protein
LESGGLATQHANKMATAVKAVAPMLRKLGFKKQRHVFNRETEPDLVQVIAFQMGQHQPPGAYEIPGLRENLYGSFTVNLGVFLEEVRTASPFVLARPKFVNDSHCHVRLRIGWLLPEQADTWWRLDVPDDDLAKVVQGLIDEYALPFFEKVKTRDELLAAWYDGDPAVRDENTTRPLTIAAIHAARGETAAAERMIAVELADSDDPGVRERLHEVADRMGLRTRRTT